MIFKFKNGYSVKIDDAAGKSKEELRDIAWAAVCQVKDADEKPVKDAVSLERTTETNTSFMPTKIKAALDEGKEDVLKTEYQFLMRDLHADASPSHKNYARIYRPEVLKKILDQYEKAYKLLAGAKELPEFVDLETVRFLIDAIHDSWLPENKLIAYILYENGEATETQVESVEDGIEHIKARIAESKAENPVVDAFVFSAATKQKLTKSYSTEMHDSAIKDVPYYEPTDYPTIKSDYSIERLKKEARHMTGNDPILADYEAVIKEIDELVEKGADALVDAGWSKDDARRAIAMRYRALEKELRKNELKDYARELHAKIRELEKAWDLRV